MDESRCRRRIPPWTIILSLLVFGLNPGRAGCAADPGGDDASRAVPAPDLKSLSRSIFMVESGEGFGNGFLVDPSGFILTERHVVGDARYVAVQIDSSRKFMARALATDGARQISVLRVHPEVVREIPAFPLPDPLATPLGDGDTVSVLVSPLFASYRPNPSPVKMSYPEEIVSDLSIQPWQMGAPLVSSAGQLVGIVTYASDPVLPQSLPRLLPIRLAGKLLSQARRNAVKAKAPRPDPLPVAPSAPYPESGLERLAGRQFDLKSYHVEAGPIDLILLTPPLLQSLARRDEGKSSSDSLYNVYRPYRHPLFREGQLPRREALVIVEAIPEVDTTSSALWHGIREETFLRHFDHAVRYHFKADFEEMDLVREGREVIPVFPGRTCRSVELPAPNVEAGEPTRREVCYGIYKYLPENFKPGSRVEIRVFTRGSSAKPLKVHLSPELMNRIWTDFQPYFESVSAQSP